MSEEEQPHPPSCCAFFCCQGHECCSPFARERWRQIHFRVLTGLAFASFLVGMLGGAANLAFQLMVGLGLGVLILNCCILTVRESQQKRANAAALRLHREGVERRIAAARERDQEEEMQSGVDMDNSWDLEAGQDASQDTPQDQQNSQVASDTAV